MLREQHEHLTPAIVAKRAEIDVKTVERVESGEGETSWNITLWIAEAIGVSMKEVAELEEAFRREEEQEAQLAERGDGEGDGNDHDAGNAGRQNP
jgi:transcriptional regulator with XRE-family HTH domain